MMDQLSDEQKFLLLGKITGTLNPEEEQELEQLFRTNPHAQSAYEDLAADLPAEDVANRFARRKANPTWRDLPAEFKKQSDTQSPVTRRLPLFRRKWVAAAAILLALVALSGILWQQFGSRQPDQLAGASSKPAIELKLANGKVVNLSADQGNIDAGAAKLNNSNKSLSYSVNSSEKTAGMNTLTVPIGLDYKIKLADGTEVWLNSATKLDFPLAFTGNTREVSINGEAYLKVAKNAAKPFIVHLPHSTVRVLGTQFNVNSYDSGLVKVALVEGSVDMRAPTGETLLVPGKQAVYAAGQPIRQETFNERQVLSWRKGLYYFNNASLEEISKVVPRWYGIQVAIDDTSILSRRFTGIIDRNRPIQVFMDDLKVIARINARVDGQGVLHFK